MERLFKLCFAALMFPLGTNTAIGGPPSLIWCNGCTAEQKQAAAVESNAGESVYVGDLVDHSTVAFDVDVKQAQATANSWRSAGRPALSAPTPDQTEAVGTLSEFHAAVPAGWRKIGTVRYPRVGVNAYDVAHDGPERRAMIAWLARQSGALPVDFMERVARAAHAMNPFEQTTRPSMLYRIEFTDSSRINVSFNLAGNAPRYEIDSELGRDSRLNPILIEPCSDPVEFDFDRDGNPTDNENWREHMAALGYTVPASATSGRWACSGIAAGLRCMQRP